MRGQCCWELNFCPWKHPFMNILKLFMPPGNSYQLEPPRAMAFTFALGEPQGAQIFVVSLQFFEQLKHTKLVSPGFSGLKLFLYLS